MLNYDEGIVYLVLLKSVCVCVRGKGGRELLSVLRSGFGGGGGRSTSTIYSLSSATLGRVLA